MDYSRLLSPVINIIYFALGIFGLWFLIQAFLVLWLWYFHDRHIKRIHNELLDIPQKIDNECKGRGVTRAGIEPLIKSQERPLRVELEKREFNRKIFLERVHLIFVFKLKS